MTAITPERIAEMRESLELRDKYAMHVDQYDYTDYVPELLDEIDRHHLEIQLLQAVIKQLRAAAVPLQVAPHGGFNIHVNENTRGPNNELAVYVICACGRGYSWELKMPGGQLLTWLANHSDDIPLEEEAQRVKAASGVKIEIHAEPMVVPRRVDAAFAAGVNVGRSRRDTP